MECTAHLPGAQYRNTEYQCGCVQILCKPWLHTHAGQPRGLPRSAARDTTDLEQDNRLTAARRPMTLVVWLILLVLCWPLALLALVLWPIVWLVSLPFRLIGITFEAVFALLRAILFLPARVLGGNPRP